MLIVSQTPWFRDWLRRTIIRESKQYLNGELTIGQVTRQPVFGVRLSDVAVDVSGERVVADQGARGRLQRLQLVSKGIVVDHIKLTAPDVRLARDATGWNIGRLVKAQRARGRSRRARAVRSRCLRSSSSMARSIDDSTGRRATACPTDRRSRREGGVRVRAGALHDRARQRRASAARTPELTMQQLTGAIAVRDDNLYLERMVIRTAESALNVGGVIENYLRTPVIKLDDGRQRVVAGDWPHRAGARRAISCTRPRREDHGRADRLALDLDVRTEAGLRRGQLTDGSQGAGLRFAGPLHVEHLNLGPILKNPAQRSDITGDVTIDLTLPSNPASDRRSSSVSAARFTFNGPRVSRVGYEAAQRARARAPSRDRASRWPTPTRNAYGALRHDPRRNRAPSGPPPDRHTISRARPAQVDMRRLPPSTRAPKLDTILSPGRLPRQRHGNEHRAARRHSINRSSKGRRSPTGTVGRVRLLARSMTYAARGTIVGLDVRRLGNALQIAALDDPRYAGRVSGDVRRQGRGNVARRSSTSPRAARSTIRRCGARTCPRWRSRPRSPTSR